MGPLDGGIKEPTSAAIAETAGNLLFHQPCASQRVGRGYRHQGKGFNLFRRERKRC